MRYTDKIVMNRELQPLIDKHGFTAEQIEDLHLMGLRVFAVGFDMGRLINPKWKPVVQCDKITGKPIEEFESALAASKKTGVSQAHISRAILGVRSYAGGFLWRYLNLGDYGIGETIRTKAVKANKGPGGMVHKVTFDTCDRTPG